MDRSRIKTDQSICQGESGQEAVGGSVASSERSAQTVSAVAHLAIYRSYGLLQLYTSHRKNCIASNIMDIYILKSNFNLGVDL